MNFQKEGFKCFSFRYVNLGYGSIKVKQGNSVLKSWNILWALFSRIHFPTAHEKFKRICKLCKKNFLQILFFFFSNKLLIQYPADLHNTLSCFISQRLPRTSVNYFSIQSCQFPTIKRCLTCDPSSNLLQMPFTNFPQSSTPTKYKNPSLPFV